MNLKKKVYIYRYFLISIPELTLPDTDSMAWFRLWSQWRMSMTHLMLVTIIFFGVKRFSLLARRVFLSRSHETAIICKPYQFSRDRNNHDIDKNSTQLQCYKYEPNIFSVVFLLSSSKYGVFQISSQLCGRILGQRKTSGRKRQSWAP